MKPKPESIEHYFNWFSGEIRERLELIREVLKNGIPEGKEVISYHMPAIKTSEVLVYYAVAKSHIGFYPTNSGVTEFKKELEKYKTSKGAIQFPHNQPLPIDLIGEIAQFRFLQVQSKPPKKKKI
jgi:uncharacterized protein YdhG (YjbR/CyaY superfamily)